MLWFSLFSFLVGVWIVLVVAGLAFWCFYGVDICSEVWILMFEHYIFPLWLSWHCSSVDGGRAFLLTHRLPIGLSLRVIFYIGFRDANMTVILHAADSHNYLSVILASWKLKMAFIIDKTGCHVSFFSPHLIFSKILKKCLTAVAFCDSLLYSFLCNFCTSPFCSDARYVVGLWWWLPLLHCCTAILFWLLMSYRNIFLVLKSFRWTHGWKTHDNEQVAIVSWGAAGVTLSRFSGAPRRYGLTTSVKCPSKGKAEEILFLLLPNTGLSWQ